MATGNRNPRWNYSQYDNPPEQQYSKASWRNGGNNFQQEPRRYPKKPRPYFHEPNSDMSEGFYQDPKQFNNVYYKDTKGFDKWAHVSFYFPHT